MRGCGQSSHCRETCVIVCRPHGVDSYVIACLTAVTEMKIADLLSRTRLARLF